ncbi:hypothetical protein [Actinomadura parmotrematis]|uniref:Translation initiation factor IF-2 n=1 Tax=Actinomadura parmotrematis TaxID=2864039 RepID=A0ABS7FM37_9ACTN|nr:hypothetical protein [Actinomadura parmotrematis]MBW8481447.1 hypothetical protein [Actinomadura parmotrematis]
MHRKTVIVAAVLAAAGCASPEGRAADRAADRAALVAHIVYDSAAVTAEEAGRRTARVRDVEVMRASGTGDVRVVIRLAGTASQGWADPQPVAVKRCFELRFGPRAEYDRAPDEVPCPRTPPITYAPLPPAPELPVEALRRALPKVPRGGAVDEAKVRAAVGGLRMDARIRREVRRSGDAVRVRLLGPHEGDGPLDCVLGSVEPGVTRVWVPSRVQRMPGEGGCAL